jgi:cobalt-precorrin 5A hydrolase/precorrin-3B C17-methyltransferase
MSTGNRLALLYITERGQVLAKRLSGLFPDAEIEKFSPLTVADLWESGHDLICIMAAGIVVRTLASLLKDKKSDPAVVVVDEAGGFAVSLVSGHLGGANERAQEIARFLGGKAVITTASDVNHLPPIDLWARDNDLTIENWALLPRVGTRFVNNGALRVYSDIPLDFPDEFLRVADPRFGDIIITNRKDVYSGPSFCTNAGEGVSAGACRVKEQLCLRSVNLVVGIGCNRGAAEDEIEVAVQRTLDEHNFAFSSIRSIATIDIKGNEPGLKAYVGKHDFPLHTFKSEELNRVEGIEKSDAVLKATGAYGVAEPAALLAAGSDKLLVHKQKKGNVTVAIAETKKVLNKSKSVPNQTGVIYIVGTGPGSLDHITPAARDAIGRSDVIVGYGTYIDLIEELLHGKEVISTGMTQEVDRCRKAVELALDKKTVSVISGGDPGVYAMAGLVFEVLRNAERGMRNAGSNQEKKYFTPEVTVIPGISALNACASRLGAPLMHDFASISLSDRLTPWDVIEKRLEAAAASDFVIVLYNPRSKGRAGHMSKAREIILRHRKPSTAVGIVKGAMREHETVIVTDLENMKDADIDMQTTVIIGNSKTFVWNNLMITPRGYDNKFKI